MTFTKPSRFSKREVAREVSLSVEFAFYKYFTLSRILMRTFLFCCAFAFSCILTAQSKGTCYSEHRIPLEPTNVLHHSDSLHHVDLVKYMMHNQNQHAVRSPFTVAVLNAISENRLQLRDRAGREVSSATYLSKIASFDTIITYDPATYEESISVVRKTPVIKGDVNVKVRLAWQYDTQRGSLQPRVEAFALLLHPDVADIWIKNSSPNATTDYLKRGSHRVKVSDFDAKGQQALSQLLPHAKMAYTAPTAVFPTQVAKEELFLIDASTEISGSVDTVVIFDPVTFEEEVSIVRNESIPADHLGDQIRLHLDWSLDTVSDSPGIGVTLRSLVTFRDVRNGDREFMYIVPLRVYVFE